MKKFLLSISITAMVFNAFSQTNTFPASGNVGIGTTSPTKKLDIKGDGINLENTNHANLNGIIFKNGSQFISDFNYGNNGTVTTFGGNTFIGFNAGNFTMGSTATSTAQSSYNTAVGNATLNQNTTGYHNTAVGFEALYYNTSGANNIAIGLEALVHNTVGNNNTANGYTALFNNTNGNNNTASGNAALWGNTSGSSNIAYGYQAGMYIADGSTANSGSSTSVFIGTNTKSLTAVDNNEIVIGYNATGAGSNTVVLGNTSITKTLLQGNVLIGKTSQTNPSYKLDVNGNIRADKVVVNTTGADYVFDSTYQLISLDSLNSYISLHHHLPDIPSAMVMQQEGLNVGENQTLLLKKIEDLTLYQVDSDKRIRQLQEQLTVYKKELSVLKSEIQELKSIR